MCLFSHSSRTKPFKFKKRAGCIVIVHLFNTSKPKGAKVVGAGKTFVIMSLLSVPLTKYCSVCHIKKDELGWTFST
jgi:hypothetical protein